MTYKLNGVQLSDYGVSPILLTGERSAISGILDLPKRKGTTEYNWKTEVEPYVDEPDITLEGRTISLGIAIKRDNIKDFYQSVESFKDKCLRCTTISMDLGDFNVICKDAIQFNFYKNIYLATAQIKFFQTEVSFPILITQSISGKISIDGYGLEESFGIYVESTKKILDIGRRIDVDTSVPYMRTKYREPFDISIPCKMVGNNLKDLYTKINQFHALCIRPGIRTLTTDNKTVKLYFRNGTTVKVLSDKLLSFDLKCRVTEWENQ